MLHGDIVDRNALLTLDNRLVLIDLVQVAPEYRGDAHALGSMMLWAVAKVDWGTAAVERVKKIDICPSTTSLRNAVDL